MYVVNKELYHHGVLGMKWGVRRYQSYAENPKLSDRKKSHKTPKQTQKTINVESLTDKEKYSYTEKRAKEFLQVYKNYHDKLDKLFEKASENEDFENLDKKDRDLYNEIVAPIANKLSDEGYEVYRGSGSDGHLSVQLFTKDKSYIGYLDKNGKIDFYEDEDDW